MLLKRHVEFVAAGPTADTDWCVITNPTPGQVAPGGVVLCWEGTLTPHPDAERAAAAGWTILRRWQDGEGR